MGWLAKGIESSNFGEPITDYVKTQLPTVTKPSDKQLQGMALHVDRFGSLVTNIPQRAIDEVRAVVGAQVPFLTQKDIDDQLTFGGPSATGRAKAFEVGGLRFHLGGSG